IGSRTHSPRPLRSPRLPYTTPFRSTRRTHCTPWLFGPPLGVPQQLRFQPMSVPLPPDRGIRFDSTAHHGLSLTRSVTDVCDGDRSETIDRHALGESVDEVHPGTRAAVQPDPGRAVLRAAPPEVAAAAGARAERLAEGVFELG